MFHKPSSASPGELRRSSSSSGGRACRQLERMAGWVSAGLYTAFFTSLDRCACVKLETMDHHNSKQEPIIILRRRSKSEQPLLEEGSGGRSSCKRRSAHERGQDGSRQLAADDSCSSTASIAA